MVYATEETPLGTAGSVLNARDELDERFVVISGDVLTDIDLTAVVDFHAGQGRAGHHRPRVGREPPRVRHRHHPRGRLDRALPGEADLGPGLQRHHQHRHLRARARDLRLHPRGTLGGLLRARSSPPSSRPAGPSTATWPEGYWEDVGTIEAYLKAHQDILDEKVQVEIDGFPLRPGVWLGKGSTVDPTAGDRRPGHHRRQLLDRGRGASWASTASSARTSGSATTPRSRRSVVNDNGYLGAGVRVDGGRRRPLLRPAPGRPLRAGRRCSARSASWAATP